MLALILRTLFLRVQEIHPTKTAAGNTVSSKQKPATVLPSNRSQRPKLGFGISVTTATYALPHCYKSVLVSFCQVAQLFLGGH